MTSFSPSIVLCLIGFMGSPPPARIEEQKESLQYPIAVAVGSQGDVFVIDQQQQAVFQLDGDSFKRLYVGSKKYRTPLYRAKSLVQDEKGTMFICDTGSMDVWRMNAAGQLTPMTGKRLDGKEGFKPDAAYSGLFDKPMALSMDAAGNVIVADLGLAGIYRLSPEGGKPELIAKVKAPRGITRDLDGSFVVVSHGLKQLVRVTTDGTVTAIIKGPVAPKGVVSFVHNVVSHETGYYVTDGYARTLWKISREGSKIEVLAQGGEFKNPVGLALHPSGYLLVTDPHARTVFRVNLNGAVSVLYKNK